MRAAQLVRPTPLQLACAMNSGEPWDARPTPQAFSAPPEIFPAGGATLPA
jgi:hypothetical protein